MSRNGLHSSTTEGDSDAFDHSMSFGEGQASGSQLVLRCNGLRASTFDDTHFASFMHVSRVVDKKFSTVSADILLKLRANASDVHAVNAFVQLCKLAAPGTAELFDQAVGAPPESRRYKDCGALLAANRPLAEALYNAAQQINGTLGGLYEGKLDCVRHRAISS